MSKNIYILPTDKFQNIKLSLFENKLYLGDIASTALPQHIYITSDEEIKERDWVYHSNKNFIFQVNSSKAYSGTQNITLSFAKKYDTCKKIILTTDPDLIADGVQAIDDEFLEWFVKNPSCESIEVEDVYKTFLEGDSKSVSNFRNRYKIIIPKEEPKQKNKICTCKRAYVNILSDICSICWNDNFPEEKEEINEDDLLNSKQETLEDALEKYGKEVGIGNMSYLKCAEFGAKWQAERMYSEEDMWEAYKASNTIFEDEIALRQEFEEWFEQFKKK